MRMRFILNRAAFVRLARTCWLTGLIFGLPPLALPEPTTGSGATRREGELLVKWADGNASYASVVGNASIGSDVKRDLDEVGWQHVKLPEGMPLPDGVARYRALESVLAVEPNVELLMILPVASQKENQTDSLLLASSSAVIPNDPRSNLQWNLKKIGAPAAWTTTTGSSNVVVAILDSGVDFTHYDLPPPVITAIAPACGNPGTVVTLSGTNFTGVTNVFFNDLPAIFTNHSDLSITAIVPDNLSPGWTQIRVVAPYGEAESYLGEKAPSFFSGTPRPLEPHQLTILKNGDLSLLLRVTDLPYQVWTVERADELGQLSWSPVAGFGLDTGLNTYQEVPITNKMGFFRLRQLDPCQ